MRREYPQIQTMELTHEIRSAKGYGTAKAKLYYDTPDQSVGYTGGWTLEEAEIEGSPEPGSHFIGSMGRDEFELVFGWGALYDLEEHAARYAEEMAEGDPDRERD